MKVCSESRLSRAKAVAGRACTLKTGSSYSALLNLPKTASTAEIRDRYRSLAIAFHPDKHRNNPHAPNGNDGPAAETQFSLIQHAYAILSDPHKRAVYDMLGEDGLREIGDTEEGDGGQGGGRRAGWKMIRRLGSPEEVSMSSPLLQLHVAHHRSFQIRRHYQRVIYEKRLASIDAMVKTKVSSRLKRSLGGIS